MTTKTLALKLLAVLFAGSAFLVAAAPAEAGHDRRDHREWRHDQRAYGHGPTYGRGYQKHRHPKHVRAPAHRTIIVQEYRYGYAPPRYGYQPPHHAHRRAPVYTRSPSIVIGVSLPPIVIPIR